MDTHRGTFTGAHELLDRLRARQAEIGLSNQGLDRICGFTPGQTDKYLGPARLKLPGLFHLMCMFDALGLSGSLHVDIGKVERITPAWRTEGKRKAAAIRDENPRISREMVRRAAPEVRRQAAQRAVNVRWDGTTVAQRQAVVAGLNKARLAKLRTRTKR